MTETEIKIDTNRVQVVAEYAIYSTIDVTLPEGKTWEDVEEWYVKWDQLNYRMKGETEFRESLRVDLSFDSCDTKRPGGVSIEEVDVDGWQTGNTLADE